MFKNILQSRWLTAGIAILILLLGSAVYRILPVVTVLNKENNNLREKISKINKNIKELEKSKEYYQDPGYLEHEARLRLNYKKPDEKVVFVYRDQYNQPEPTADKSQGLFEILKRWLANLIGK